MDTDIVAGIETGLDTLLVLGYVMGQLLHLSELGSIGTAALAFALSVGILILVEKPETRPDRKCLRRSFTTILRDGTC